MPTLFQKYFETHFRVVVDALKSSRVQHDSKNFWSCDRFLLILLHAYTKIFLELPPTKVSVSNVLVFTALLRCRRDPTNRRRKLLRIWRTGCSICAIFILLDV